MHFGLEWHGVGRFKVFCKKTKIYRQLELDFELGLLILLGNNVSNTASSMGMRGGFVPAIM